MRGARTGVGSSVGLGTNFKPRSRTSISVEDRGVPERLMTVLEVVVGFLVGVVLERGPWKEGVAMFEGGRS